MSRSVVPSWAKEILTELAALHRKVNLLMALDTTLLARIMAGAQSLVDQSKTAAATIASQQATISSQADTITQLQGEVSSDQATIAADAQATDQANQQLTDTADALDALLKGPDTPVVQTPDPGQAPAVISGQQDPVVVTEDPTPNDAAG